MDRFGRVGFGLLLVAGVMVCGATSALADNQLREKPLVHAGDAYVTGEILVTFRPGVSEAAKAAVHGRRGGRRLRVGYGNAFDVVAAAAGSEEALAQLYGSDPDVLYAEPNYRVHAHFEPNDPFFSFQWHMPQVKAQAGWDVSTGSGAIIAIVDSGIRLDGSRDGFTNSPLMLPGSDFINNDDDPTDDNGHGTHVAGTACQATNNGVGVTGLAFNARCMAVKVLGANGSGSLEAVTNGIRFAADQGADVLNLSLGRPPQFGPSPTEHAAVQYAVNKGTVVVASSGNDNSRRGVGCPACYDEAIAVGATRVDKNVPRYSNKGPELDLVAPGGDSKDQNGDGFIDGVLQETFDPADGSWAYWFYVGTSQAAPHVSAAAALLIEHGVGAGLTGAVRVAAVRSVLESTAEDLGKAGRDDTYGWGLLDVEAALGGTPPPPDTTPPILSNVQAINVTSSSATITWDTDESATSQVDYGLDATYGATVADGALVTAHSVMLIGLSAATLYHYQATSADGSGNSASSGDLTFTTAAAGGTDQVVVTKAAFRMRNGQLKVEATSSAGGSATLTVTSPSTGFDYGTMSYDSNKDLFKFTANKVPDPGDDVTVTSSEGGSDTAAVTHK